MTTHVVLGGAGVVGRETIAALLSTEMLRAEADVASVGRSAVHTPGIRSILADLLDPQATLRALDGADVAYLTVGLPYRLAVWRRDWPVIMRNVIDGCLANGTRLIYFDNVYAYGRVTAPMTETTPIRPSSRKGQLRAALLGMLASGADRGLAFTVARAADFYGPGASTSVFNRMVSDRVTAGKEPTWMLDSSQPHSMTYTPDIGRALAILGTDDRSRASTTWHVPTAPALSGEEYLTLATGGRLRHRTMSAATLRIGALFVPDAREALELSYQNTEPYVFDSSLFESTFDVDPTSYSEGIARTLELASRASSPSR